jgi:tetratricopeptide (TPR) repeat protein
MSAKKHDLAIESYDKAIALDPLNSVYFSNRAAAYSSKGDHASAVLDAEKAIEVDPSFVKAYSRLGYVVPHGDMHTRGIEHLLQTCSVQFGRLQGRGGRV